MKKTFFNVWRVGLIGVFLLAILVYLPSLMGASVWDDDDLLTGKATGGGTLAGAFMNPFLGHYFRPLTSASFVVDSSYGDITPFFFHQTNILLHGLTSVLICWLVLSITQKRLAGLLAGVFFALQPVQVGAVAWIGGRTDVLSAFFLAAFLATLVHYYRSTKYVWLIVSAIALLLAALTKEQAMAMLPAVPISVFVFGKGKWQEVFKVCVPFVFTVFGFASLWILYAPEFKTSPFELLHSARLALLTLSEYGIALFVPTRASEMTFTVENFQNTLWVLCGLAILAGVVFTCRILLKNHRPVVWLILCGILVYLPISNFPPVPSFVTAPYRVAETGTCFACVLGIAGAYAISKRKYVLGIALAANLTSGAVVTWWAIHQWLTPHSIFQSVAMTDPRFMVGQGNYSHVLNMESRAIEALPYTDRLLSWLFGTDKWFQVIHNRQEAALTPQVKHRLLSNSGVPDPVLLGWFLGCHASTLTNLKRDDEALEVTKDALMFGPLDPRMNYGYGQMILSTHRSEALRHWEIAMSMSPNYSACAISLAHERLKDGLTSDAIELLEPALGRNPWNCSGWMDLARAKMKIHKYSEALDALDKAEHGIFPNKPQIESLRSQIRSLKNRS